MTTFKQNIAVIGAGYWGKNLVRNFYELGSLRWVCDACPDILTNAEKTYGVNVTPDLNTILADAETKGVAIAVPAAQHFDVAMRCLRAGKDVYVEKPLALHAEEGRQLVAESQQSGGLLMVGHILEYHPAILELKRLVDSGELGKIEYIYSSRLNLGKLRTEEDILWSFAPHDISAILFLLNESPQYISAQGGSYLNHNVDTTLTTCEFPSGVQAHIFVSWLHPFKEQKLVVVGSQRMAVFDDVERERKLVLYSHRIDWVDRVPIAHKESGQVLALPPDEPLRLECQHFLQCMETRQTPRTCGKKAVAVLEVLEACERSLRMRGQPIETLPRTPAAYSAHPTAVIDDGAEIGEGTKIWHFSHIMTGSKIGKGCNLGQNVVVSPGVVIGNNVKIQNNVSVYTGVLLEDDVFCGPSMVFTNVINPRSHIIRRHEYKRTLVQKGASIGANATIVCGVTLGRYCFIGAGATVIRDVPDYALMVGTPAKQIGWMCYCGVTLPKGRHATCGSCGRTYDLSSSECHEVTAEPALAVVAS